MTDADTLAREILTKGTYWALFRDLLQRAIKDNVFAEGGRANCNERIGVCLAKLSKRTVKQRTLWAVIDLFCLIKVKRVGDQFRIVTIEDSDLFEDVLVSLEKNLKGCMSMVVDNELVDTHDTHDTHDPVELTVRKAATQKCLMHINHIMDGLMDWHGSKVEREIMMFSHWLYACHEAVGELGTEIGLRILLN